VSTDDRYRRAAAAGGVGVWDWNLVTGDIFVDPLLKELLGYQDHEIPNRIEDWGRLVHPDDAGRVFERARAHIAGAAPAYEIEHRMVHRDGSIRWFLARGAVVRGPDGTALFMAGTDTDITERRRGEEALRQAEAMNRRIVESTGDCVKILGLDGKLLYINPEGLRALELTDASRLLSFPLTGFLDEASRQAADAALRAARGGGRGRFQYMMRTATGMSTWWDAVVTPITDVDGTVVQLLMVSRDVTDRRRDEGLRTGQHQVLELIATGAPLPAVLDSIVRFVESEADGMACTVLLLDDEGKAVEHGAAPSMPSAYLEALRGVSIGPKVGSCGTAMYRAEPVIVVDVETDPLWEDYRDLAARFRFRACWSTPIFSPERKVLGSLAMYYAQPRAPRDAEQRLIDVAADIARIAIEQHRAYQALQRSEARTRAILRAIPDWMFLTTLDGVFLDFHAQDASKLYAAPASFIGRAMRDVLPPPVADALAAAFTRAIATSDPEKIEYTLDVGGQQGFFEAVIVTCDGDKILSIVRDVTDRKRAELEADSHRRELAHLGRVATLGELSGTLAHELSQPLTAVLSNAQAARRLLDRDPPDVDLIRSALDDVIRNDKRAGAVIEHLRSLLRKDDAPRQPVDLNDVVRETLDLAVGELLSRRVVVTRALGDAIPLVEADRVQLQQVVLNLLMNACDAMDGTPAAERRLLVSTVNGNGFVRLAVTDRGPGIPDGQLERVFEPFVTFRDQGLGLGLAISRSIVTAHGGKIRAENNPDGGATFHCALPVIAAV
jgi:PAS domain S-box-containing protein